MAEAINSPAGTTTVPPPAAEQVADVLRAVLRHVSPDRLYPCTNCGMVPLSRESASGKLRGLYIWGDVAYRQAMFFSPDYWRKVYKPQLRRICAAAHAAGLKTIFPGPSAARTSTA